MLFSGISILYLLLAGVLYLIARLALLKRHNAQQTAKLGCLPPPSPPDRGLWGIKSLRASLKATKDGWGPVWMHQTFNSIGKDVHTMRAQVLDYELLITRDAENIKAMFNTQSADFDIGPHRERTFKSLLGLGVMTNRGVDWKHSRELIRPQFARDNVANLAMFETHVQSLVKRLRVDAGEWTAKVDLQPLFQNLTLDTSTEFLYGHSASTQDPEQRAKLPTLEGRKAPDLANFGHHLDEAKHVLDRQGALAKYSWLVRDGTYSTHRQAVHEFVDYFVHMVLSQTAQDSKMETSDIMRDKVVLLRELMKETRDPLRLRNETLNVLHASRDTTAALVGWIFYFFTRREDVFAKAREEVVERFGSKEVGELSFSDLWSLSYLPLVVNETIRFVGIVPMNERAAVRDTTLPRGGGPDGRFPVFVPKGGQVLIPTYSLQHREDIWGADVEEYKPERWASRKSGWDFVPFGGGARQCIGQQFARTEVLYVVVRLLQIFDGIENLEEPDAPMTMHHTIENRPGNGVQVKLRFAEKGVTS